jgi:hypothetical protein
MGFNIRDAEYLDAKQVREYYGIKRSTLDRRVLEGKIVVSIDKKFGAKKGTNRYLHDSIKQYKASLGNGLEKKTDQNYRYNSVKKYPFPTFSFNKADIYPVIDLD